MLERRGRLLACVVASIAFVDATAGLRAVQQPPVVEALERYARGEFEAALASVFLRRPSPGRQHVVISMTDGWHGGDLIPADTLAAVAQRADARLFVLIRERDHDATTWRRDALRPVCPQASAQWTEDRRRRLMQIDGIPLPNDQLRALVDVERRSLTAIAEGTGGRAIRPAIFRRSIAEPVRQVLEETRSGYVLYYEPAGVSEPGWHPIEVTIARAGRYDVTGRPGYQR